MTAQSYNAQFAWLHHFGGGLAPSCSEGNPFAGLDPGSDAFESATRALQAKAHLTMDGKFGPKTLDAYIVSYGAPSLCAHGVDVSGHQRHAAEDGGVNFSNLKQQGFSFAIVKATEGVGPISRRCLEHISSVQAAGMELGLYTYATPWSQDTNDASAEATNFIKHLEKLQPFDLIPALDIEDKGYKLNESGKVERGSDMYQLWERNRPAYVKRMTVWLETWIDRFVALMGYYPLIYTYPSYLKRFELTPKIAQCPLWLAAYVLEDPRQRYAIDSRWNLVCQQWTSDGDERSGASGYPHDLDLNRAPWGLQGMRIPR